MPVVTLTNLEKSFGDRIIFERLNFLIDRGERVGLIGDNGAGKTTLFKIITGEVQPESGTVATLSGGQRSKLNLAKLLIAKPDLLLLDEPTNHLDLLAIEWLEKYLLDFDGAVLLISHDRYLLDRLATRIVWLTRHQLSSYPGNYSAFVQQREVQELTQRRAFDEQQQDIAKQQEF